MFRREARSCGPGCGFSRVGPGGHGLAVSEILRPCCVAEKLGLCSLTVLMGGAALTPCIHTHKAPNICVIEMDYGFGPGVFSYFMLPLILLKE